MYIFISNDLVLLAPKDLAAADVVITALIAADRGTRIRPPKSVLPLPMRLDLWNPPNNFIEAANPEGERKSSVGWMEWMVGKAANLHMSVCSPTDSSLIAMLAHHPQFGITSPFVKWHAGVAQL